jgi:hypothetical protein
MLKQIKKYYIVTPVIIAIFALYLIVVMPSVSAYTNYLSDKTLSPIYEVNTRIKAIEFNATQLTNYTLTKFGSGCPPEIAIYIHGFNKDDGEAKEEFNRIQKSLNHNNYRIPLVGFSWDSKTLWEIAKTNTKQNGENLTKYIITLTNKCPNINIHLIAHSLGAAVVESALVSLNNNSNWSSKIASIHLLGAAISNQSIAQDSHFGNAINDIVDKFYNLYNPEDEGLKVNQLYENYQPLGLVGSTSEFTPSNYIDTNVAYEILPFSDADGNGNVEECFENIKSVQKWGDNHCGYIGFRNDEGSLLDDGAMNIVVRDWLKS